MANELKIKIPDIGGASGVDVIEILVKEGDKISNNESLITLESDKASMEIPSTASGTIKKLNVKVGDKVSEGDVILTVITEDSASETVSDTNQQEQANADENFEPKQTVNKDDSSVQDASSPTQSDLKTVTNEKSSSNTADSKAESSEESIIAAGPAVRRLAREFGVNLHEVAGSGRKSRVTKEDIQSFVKSRLSGSTSPNNLGIPVSPTIDFSQFGTIETRPLNKIKKLTGTNVHRSWITIPHVTQFDSADITDIEAFRRQESDQAATNGYKLTLLAFVCAVVSKALHQFPQFNASLNPEGTELILKKYYNIGIAVETPNGLVVPVLKNVNNLSVAEIAQEMARLSTKAREKGLMPNDMNGGCFTISSLGGIGGTAFTPIVNSPEVAILGLSRSEIKPIYIDGQFVPRLHLPLSLSYDHRVIDGAEAARFTRYIAECLADIRKILL